jgi:outer membrane protein OmpA-like peptidoglycan-associated protein
MKKKITQLLLSIFLLFSAITVAQEKKVDRADDKYNQYSFVKAIDIYEKVVSKGYKSAEILKKLGNAYYFNADYDNASKWYGELVQMKDSVIEPDYYFRYAQSLKSLKEYDQADAMMAKFDALKDKDVRAQIFENKKEYLEFIKLQSGRYTIEPFQQNSEYSDFAPSFLKGNLVFSSARDTGSLRKRRHSWNEMPFLDLYGGELKEDKVIGVQKFSSRINTKMHESSTTFTKDGNTMYFTRNNFVKSPKYGKDGINRLKIYKATKQGNEWGNIIELPFNSDDYSVAHPALSPDESKLYFASDMPGTTGESDIYVVTINNDGSFGTPINLGTSINTEARETFPYVSESGLLYFASDGHQGLGGLDVYVTKLDGATNVGEIINVGEPVNSPEDDFSFVINESTKIGFFASNRDGGLGSDDIYTFTEHSPVIFSCNQLVTGAVRDKDTNNVLPSAIVYVIDENNNEVSKTTADDMGRYSLTINCKKGHFIRATKEGYETKEEFLAASFNMEDKTLDFYLEKATVTAVSGDDLAKILDLKPIYFDFDKANIRPDAELELQKVIAALEKYPTLKIDVRSHTDSRGVDAYNLKLSDRRAKSTVQYIIDKGIDASRITGKGYGETQLVNQCENGVQCSKEQHQLNRRSEFIIMN